MYCVKCGAQHPDDSQFCPECGATLQCESKAKDTEQTLGLISMILGFVAVGTQVLGTATSASLPAAIAALIIGFLAKNRAAEKGLTNTKAKTGIICAFAGIGYSIFTTILAFGIIVLYFAFFAFMMIAAGV